ncbi:hypothetical protein M0802_005174 [Mischocyttarus mexicanus]|nr:hypothetical protein M0802_005174 [Mischocyttarus mexicanus]
MLASFVTDDDDDDDDDDDLYENDDDDGDSDGLLNIFQRLAQEFTPDSLGRLRFYYNSGFSQHMLHTTKTHHTYDSKYVLLGQILVVFNI